VAWRRDGDELRHARLVTLVESMLVRAAQPVMETTWIEPGSFLVDGGSMGKMFIPREALAELFRSLSRVGLSSEEVLEALGALDERGLIGPSRLEPKGSKASTGSRDDRRDACPSTTEHTVHERPYLDRPIPSAVRISVRVW